MFIMVKFPISWAIVEFRDGVAEIIVVEEVEVFAEVVVVSTVAVVDFISAADAQ